MKTDAQLKADVLAELAWDPAVNPAAIGVIVKNGLVTLTGHLDTLAQKHAAERAVRRVAGVRDHDAAIGAAFGTRGVTSVVDKLEVAG